MYKLIGSPKTRAIRVVWMLEELGLDYEIDPAGPHSDAVLSGQSIREGASSQSR